ncbi:MAG: hypothetical protein Kow0010_02680 [Dehalococcoidia bacterium]
MKSATARFLAAFARGAAPGVEGETLVTFAGEQRCATVYRPRDWRGGGPGWVLLHGVTIPGRHHEALRRMARSLAAAGHACIVPEVPPWTELRVDPGETATTAAAARAALTGRWGVDARRVGLMGFSVVATWALEVAANELRGEFAAVAAMAGYGDLHATLRGMVCGEAEWEGTVRQYRPDPYGRWIMGANLLPLLDHDRFGGQNGRDHAADALRVLASTAGHHGALAESPVYQTLIGDLRAGLTADARRAWDLLAPPGAAAVDIEAARDLAAAMASAALRRYPGLDPAHRLGELDAPAVLFHGRADRLIPYTETLRLASYLPPGVPKHVGISRLVGHTKARETRRPRNPVTLAVEAERFAATIDFLLGTVD